MQQKFPARPHLVKWQGRGYQQPQVAVMPAGKYVPGFQNIKISKTVCQEVSLWCQSYLNSPVRRFSRKRRNTGDSTSDASSVSHKVHICSVNNFPTAAGLASSASGYACLGEWKQIAYTVPIKIVQPPQLARHFATVNKTLWKWFNQGISYGVRTVA